MRIGANDKTKFRLMLVLSAAAALLLSRNFFFQPHQVKHAGSASAQKKAAVHQEAASVIDLRLNTLASMPTDTGELGRRNLFRMQETEVDSKNTSHGSSPPPNPAPLTLDLPPLIPLKFYGFARKQADSAWIFLQDNQEVFVTRLGDTVERRYKVIELKKNGAVIEDVLSNQRQLVPLN